MATFIIKLSLSYILAVFNDKLLSLTLNALMTWRMTFCLPYGWSVVREHRVDCLELLLNPEYHLYQCRHSEEINSMFNKWKLKCVLTVPRPLSEIPLPCPSLQGIFYKYPRHPYIVFYSYRNIFLQNGKKIIKDKILLVCRQMKILIMRPLIKCQMVRLVVTLFSYKIKKKYEPLSNPLFMVVLRYYRRK